MFGTVPGGANDTKEYRFHKDFDKGMNEYAKARDEGLQPKHSTLDAVKDEHKKVKSQQRALKKLSKVADTDGIPTAPGVRD